MNRRRYEEPPLAEPQTAIAKNKPPTALGKTGDRRKNRQTDGQHHRVNPPHLRAGLSNECFVSFSQYIIFFFREKCKCVLKVEECHHFVLFYLRLYILKTEVSFSRTLFYFNRPPWSRHVCRTRRLVVIINSGTLFDKQFKEVRPQMIM